MRQPKTGTANLWTWLSVIMPIYDLVHQVLSCESSYPVIIRYISLSLIPVLVTLSVVANGNVLSAVDHICLYVHVRICSASLASLTRDSGPKLVKGDPAKKSDTPKVAHQHSHYFTPAVSVSDSSLKFTHVLYNLSPAGNILFYAMLYLFVFNRIRFQQNWIFIVELLLVQILLIILCFTICILVCRFTWQNHW